MTPGLAIGSAECVSGDLQALERLAGPLDRFTICAANDGGVIWPGRLDYWFTLHPDELPEREERRREAGHPDGYVTVSISGDVDRILSRDWHLEGGSSGLDAAAWLHHVGHRRIVLCGVPLGPQRYAVTHPQHGDAEWPHWRGYQERVPSLAKQHSWLRECIRSMSGWTAEFFGEPTEDWIG